MCTVSYLPLHGGGYILTSNRDEAPQRNAAEIRRTSINGQILIYPRDPLAGGSWFCVSEQDKAGCLLNGALQPFTPDPRYTHSRGNVLLDCVQHNSVKEFLSSYDLTSTAPFTLVLIVDKMLHELIWDGTDLTHQHKNAEHPSFWSSVTLYPQDVREWRATLFQQWVEAHPLFDQEAIMRFHQYGSTEDQWNGFVMNREERVKTLTITSVMRQGGEFTFVHRDLSSGDTRQEKLSLITTDVA